MANPKVKGNVFERKMSRLLSLWWTNEKRDDAIWRSASSGALTTVGKGRYLAHTGDFAATDEEATLLFKHVIIEAKRGYNRYSMQDLLDVPAASLPKNPVWEMVDKLGFACRAQNKYGILLWKRDRRDLLVFVFGNLFAAAAGHTEMPSGLRVWLGQTYLNGLTWERFASIVSADRLKTYLSRADN